MVFDRYLIDTVIDPKRYRYQGPSWVLRTVWRVVPKPDLVILLDAPAEVLHARKQEVPIEETIDSEPPTARSLEACKKVMLSMERRLQRRVAADVVDIVIKTMAQRTAKRLGLESRNG